MKVYIGPYSSDMIPISRWKSAYTRMRAKSLGIAEWDFDEKHYRWYDLFIEGIFDTIYELCIPLNRWSNGRKRNIKVHIDDHDVWGADHTLAMIIAPTLKKLKEKHHGSPLVEDEDVPVELRLELTQKQKDDWDDTVAANHDARWEWVLDEMIWAFEQHTDPNDGEQQFCHNADQMEIVFTPLLDNPKQSSLSINYQKDPSKPAYWFDQEGNKKHHARKVNGVRLFAKYYESLWD